ncbi:MAG: hypothetical protein ACLT98_17150, partial [Eggerthellaceae bacterium]
MNSAGSATCTAERRFPGYHRGLRERQERQHAEAPHEQPRLRVGQLLAGAVGNRRLHHHEDQKRPDEQGERRVQRGHGRTEVLSREHGLALDAHRRCERLRQELRVGAQHRAQRVRVARDQRLVHAVGERFQLARRFAQLLRRLVHLRARIAQHIGGRPCGRGQIGARRAQTGPAGSHVSRQHAR